MVICQELLHLTARDPLHTGLLRTPEELGHRSIGPGILGVVRELL